MNLQSEKVQIGPPLAAPTYGSLDTTRWPVVPPHETS